MKNPTVSHTLAVVPALRTIVVFVKPPQDAWLPLLPVEIATVKGASSKGIGRS